MANNTKKQRRIKAKKISKAKAKRRGFAGIYDHQASGESSSSAIISFGLALVDLSGPRRTELKHGMRQIVKKYRARALTRQVGRGGIRSYLGTSGHSFMEMMRLKGVRATSKIADDIITTKLSISLATNMGHVVEDVAALFPISSRQKWHSLDSNGKLRDKVGEILGHNILKQLDLYGVHDCEGGRILRLIGLKLNAVSSNGKDAQYASNSLSDVAAILRLAKSVGADRVEIVLGRAYDHGDAQPKSVLKKIEEELKPKGWKRFDLAAQHPCIASPDGSLQFRVMVGSRLWGYIARPRDKSGELDVMAMLTRVQEEESVEGQALLNTSKRTLVASMEEEFRLGKAAFLADPRYAYLVRKPEARQKLCFWGETFTGSWKLPQNTP